MTAHNREIKKAVENDYAGWTQYLVVAIFSATLGGEAEAETITFNDPIVTEEDHFGTSIALNDNNVLVGARFDDTLGNNVGQAHLFDAVTGNLLRTFNDPIVTGGDRFGQSMALDGNNVLISAYHHAFSLARLMICRRAVGWRDAACADSSDPRLWVFCDVTHQAAGHEWVAASFVTLRSAS